MRKVFNKSQRIVDCWNRIGVWSISTLKCKKLEEYVHCRNCPVFTDAGHLVFEKQPPTGYLAQWRKDISEKATIDNLAIRNILVFRIGVEWLSLPTNVLSEVANERAVHKIPRNLNQFISGIVNINGEVNVCYSLGELLGLNEYSGISVERDPRKPKRLIVIDQGASKSVFLVDEVKGILWYRESDVAPVPATLNHEDADLLLGTIKRQGHQIALLNIDNLKAKLERLPR